MKTIKWLRKRLPRSCAVGSRVGKGGSLGQKAFAYPSKTLEGFYVLYTFKLDPAQVKEMERLLSLRPQVIRHMVVNLEEK